MTEEAVVDTNVLVDAMVEEASRHAEARGRIERLKRAVIPTVVLYEMVWVLNRLGADPETVKGAVETLALNPKISVAVDDGRITTRAMRRLVDEKTSLSNFDDKVVLETALGAGLPLMTYDRELEGEWKRATGVVGGRTG